MNPTRKGSRMLALAVCMIMLLAVAAPAMAASVVGYATVAVTTSTVYKDSTKAQVIGYFSNGDVVAVISQTTNGMYRVLQSGTSGLTGYIVQSEVGKVLQAAPNGRGIATMKTSASGVTNTGSASSSSASASSSSSTSASASTSTNTTDTPQTDSTSTVAATGIINANSTRMYTDAATSSRSVQTLRKNNVVDITGQTTSGFYQCTYNSKTGYVEAGKVDVLPATTAASGTGVVNASTSLYKNPHTATGSVSSLSKNAKITITGEAGTYYQASYNSKTGYVDKSKVTLDAGASTGSGGSTGSSGASSSGISTVTGNVRVMPGSSTISSGMKTKLDAAKKKNADVIGYFELSGTNISQPILSKGSSDPYYYLDRDINKKSSSAGSVTAFYNVLVRNNTVTGHNMRVSGTMLHQLHHLQEKAIGKSKCDYKSCGKSLSSVPNMKTDASARIWTINLHGYNQWEVWAMYEVPKNEPKSTLQTNINSLNGYSEAQRNDWISKQVKRSQVAFGSTPTADDILMTVYTCGTNYDSATAQSRLFFFLKAVK